MNELATRLERVRTRIADACQRHGRRPGEVRLLAVSKTQPAEVVAACHHLGQACFGENQLQEASAKIAALGEPGIEWHFIGTIQSNKTRDVAEQFQWVHSVDRLKIARRLSAQRLAGLPPLQICLQINVGAETTKGGVSPADAHDLAWRISELPGLRLRGLMAIPEPSDGFQTQRLAFRELRELQETLVDGGLALDTLSMGMSADLEAAIAEGATLVRIGTAIFGHRRKRASAH